MQDLIPTAANYSTLTPRPSSPRMRRRWPMKATMSYVENLMENAQTTIASIDREMAKYFTPAEGHKVSRRSSVEKWVDFLFIAESGQRTAASDEEALVWFRLECQVVNQLRDWNAAHCPA